MKIGELATHAGCDVQTVRFYEREGLLEEPPRDASGYRHYDERHVSRLRFIRHLRTLDIPLARGTSAAGVRRLTGPIVRASQRVAGRSHRLGQAAHPGPQSTREAVGLIAQNLRRGCFASLCHPGIVHVRGRPASLRLPRRCALVGVSDSPQHSNSRAAYRLMSLDQVTKTRLADSGTVRGLGVITA